MQIITNSDVMAERGFLSTVCRNMNNLADAVEAQVDEEWFSVPIHARMWSEITKVEEPSELMDVDVMLSFRDDSDRIEVQDIFALSETGAKWHTYFETLREAVRKKKLTRISNHIQDSLQQGTPSEKLAEQADKMLTEITIETKDSVREARSVVDSMWEAILKRKELGGMSGIKSGLKRLDSMTYGWKPGELIVISARTSVGKTALGCEFALNATRESKSVLFFSLEMKAEAVMQRFCSNQSEVPLGYIVDSTAREEDMDKYHTAMDYMRTRKLWIDDRGMINSAQVRAKARKYARKGLDMIVVDYCQKMSAIDTKMSREQQVAEIVGSMKSLAMELDIPVILLSQLNRGADEANRKPRLSDMRESGSLEQDADVVLQLWRKDDDPDKTIISVNKQRDGRCGDVEVCFKPKIQKFTPRDSDPVLN